MLLSIARVPTVTEGPTSVLFPLGSPRPIMPTPDNHPYFHALYTVMCVCWAPLVNSVENVLHRICIVGIKHSASRRGSHKYMGMWVEVVIKVCS